MALSKKSGLNVAPEGGTTAITTEQFNALLNVVHAIADKLDDDSGVTDSDYVALVEAGAKLVADENGRVL